jgi:hypothetical protein
MMKGDRIQTVPQTLNATTRALCIVGMLLVLDTPSGHTRRVFRLGCQETEGKRDKATVFVTVARMKDASVVRLAARFPANDRRAIESGSESSERRSERGEEQRAR